jgi:hypothetical protein
MQSIVDWSVVAGPPSQAKRSEQLRSTIATTSSHTCSTRKFPENPLHIAADNGFSDAVETVTRIKTEAWQSAVQDQRINFRASYDFKIAGGCFVTKLAAFAFAGVAAVALVGTAMAAGPKTHKLDIPLPDGSIAHVEYVGEIAPRVTIAPRHFADVPSPWALPVTSYGGFEKIIDEMNRRMDDMMREAHSAVRQPMGTVPYVASFGKVPPGETATTIVTVSNGTGTCTRTTHVESQGKSGPPKVTSNLTGQCGADTVAPRGSINPT